jgi:hypothetical protein
MHVSPSQNPVRDQLYEAQIEYYNIEGTTRHLKARLKAETNADRRYKRAYIKKKISATN